ncbi:MAG: hypothetical protein DWQ37_13355 [Planctomycetota bacterium]|nr:MAG: hypothetical protein DWQ37_13355 [Planctomycetota bacterium]
MTTTELPPPKGSNIEIVDDFDGRTYRWKPVGGGPFRFLIALFLAAWLCGWVAGLVAVIGQLLQNNGGAGQGFLIFWLVGWTVGGLFAGGMLFVLVRPPLPESITLKRASFYYDAGTTTPMHMFHPAYAMRHQNPAEMFRLFRRRKRVEMDKAACPIVLDRVGERQRFFFDDGADRIEIGEQLREPEREWLAAVIAEWQESR